MAETTGIAWTDATFNPWIGCTKVGPGCDHCYAEASNARFNPAINPASGQRTGTGVNWGPSAPRRRTTPANWRKPLQWNYARQRGAKWLREPKAGKPGIPVPLWVFCASQADVFDNEVPEEWRADLWALIRATPFLRWQLVTKRVGNVAKMLPADWAVGKSWGEIKEGATVEVDYGPGAWYRHVGIIATMVNQEEWDRDAHKLVRLKEIGVRWVGASVEPQIGAIQGGPLLPFFDWIICGGESIQKGQARPFDLAWARSLRDQCGIADVPFFMKQIGSRPVGTLRVPIDRAGADPGEWPADLRIRQMPRIYAERMT